MSKRARPTVSHHPNKRRRDELDAIQTSDDLDESEVYDTDDDNAASCSENGSENDFIQQLDEDEDDEGSDEESSEDFQFPSKSYQQISSGYNNSQKKLETDYVYNWLPGEQKYDGKLKNEILLSDKDKKDISRSSLTELFEVFFSSELKEFIIRATKSNGYEMTEADFDKFLGILVFSSFNKRLSQRDYWSTNPHLRSEPVVSAMSRKQFEKIKSSLKFHRPEDENKEDKAWRVRKLLDIFQKNTTKYGWFATALSIDEMMVKFFGKLSIKQFIPMKPIRFGIKLWAVCGPDGFVFYFDIYCGKNSQGGTGMDNIPLGSRVVLQMCRPLLNATAPRKLQKYHIYFDNLFSSPDLLIHLKRIGLRATGVVRNDRVKEKNDLDKKAKRGMHVVKHDKASGMNFITVKDSKNVSLLSTAAGVTPLATVQRYDKEKKAREDLQFPNAFSQYNKFMGGVDLHDKYCNKVLPSMRSKKWTWVVFLRLIQASITNATVLHNAANPEKKLGTKEVALAISRDYFARSENKSEHNLSQASSPLYNCSSPKCSIRTRNYCNKCAKYFCASCLAANKTCMEPAVPEENHVIKSRNKKKCSTARCSIRTARYCETCQKYFCKKCSEGSVHTN